MCNIIMSTKILFLLFMIGSCSIYNKKDTGDRYNISWEKFCIQQSKNKYGKKIVVNYNDFIEVTINNLSDTAILFPICNNEEAYSNFYLCSNNYCDTIFLYSSVSNIIIPPKEKLNITLTQLGNLKGMLTMDEYQKDLSYKLTNYNLYYKAKLNKEEKVDSVVQDIVVTILSNYKTKDPPIDTIQELNPIIIPKKSTLNIQFCN